MPFRRAISVSRAPPQFFSRPSSCLAATPEDLPLSVLLSCILEAMRVSASLIACSSSCQFPLHLLSLCFSSFILRSSSLTFSTAAWASLNIEVDCCCSCCSCNVVLTCPIRCLDWAVRIRSAFSWAAEPNCDDCLTEESSFSTPSRSACAARTTASISKMLFDEGAPLTKPETCVSAFFTTSSSSLTFSSFSWSAILPFHNFSP
mmetsp:Transcript_112572/g.223780  ORF Transcript_112572/g.223780 Transcript_112572/m.223780 type:complete len:204 (-) Transcript_112572:1524-2135(-)